MCDCEHCVEALERAGKAHGILGAGDSTSEPIISFRDSDLTSTEQQFVTLRRFANLRTREPDGMKRREGTGIAHSVDQ